METFVTSGKLPGHATLDSKTISTASLYPRGRVGEDVAMVGQFSDWQAYYAADDFESLIEQAARFRGVAPVDRVCAYLVRLIDVVCDDPNISDDDRIKAMSVIGIVEDAIRDSLGRRDPAALARFERSLGATFDRVRTFSLYPQIVEMIASGQFTTTRNQQIQRAAPVIPRPLVRNPIAEILARSPSGDEIA